MTKPQKLPIEAITRLGRKSFNLEVARTSEEIALGMMFRDNIPNNRGMLFLLQNSHYVNFWMHNVYFPLDMIFLRDGKIKSVLMNIPPCLANPQYCPMYGPSTLIDQVIEIKGGEAAKLRLKINSSVSIKYLKYPYYEDKV